MQRSARAQNGLPAVEPADRGAAAARLALVAGVVAPFEIVQRVRCSRLPPTVAMLRSCCDAPSRSALASTG